MGAAPLKNPSAASSIHENRRPRFFKCHSQWMHRDTGHGIEAEGRHKAASLFARRALARAKFNAVLAFLRQIASGGLPRTHGVQLAILSCRRAASGKAAPLFRLGPAVTRSHRRCDGPRIDQNRPIIDDRIAIAARHIRRHVVVVTAATADRADGDRMAVA